MPIEWILTGETTDTIEESNEEVSELLRATQRILNSGDVIARVALKENIICFDRTVSLAIKQKSMQDQMEEMRQEIRELKKVKGCGCDLSDLADGAG